MKQVTNDIRKDILVSLKDGDKRHSEIRRDIGIDKDNRSSLNYHLEYLMGDKNAKFDGNPLVEEYRNSGTQYYTAKTGKLDFKWNTDYFMPYIYLALIQIGISMGVLYQFSQQAFIGYIGSTLAMTVMVSVWVAFKEDIREVYYQDDDPDREESSISDKISNLYN